MKNKNTREMWKNALSQIDEKYIAEAADIAPDSENSAHRAAPEKSGTGNLGFVFAAAAAMLATVIGVGFFFKGTGIEPLSPGSEGTNESFTQSDAPATTTAISDSGAITTSIIGEYAEITTAISPIDRESYQDWFREAEEIKEEYGRQMEEKEKEIEECEKLIDDLKKRLETEKFKEKADYDKVKAELEIKTARLENLKLELEKLEADYYEQVLIIENNRKTYEQLYPTTEEINKPLTMEKLKALVSAKGKELTWSDFEQFEGEDIGSGLYIMEYPIDSAFKLVVGGVPTEKPWYIRLIYNVDESVFSITDNGADGFEEFINKFSPFALLGDCYEGQDGLFHVSDEKWVVSDDFDLFREYFFGVWGEDYIIDDSEKDWVAASRSMYFDNFYKVNDNVLAVVYHGFAGGELRWLDMRNPDVLYEAYGDIGDFPHGFQINEDGKPAVFTRNKTSNETNKPENNYLSIYRLKELSKQYGIPLETLADIEIQDENGAVYHDSKYNFHPMYLVFEADNRLVINTEARMPYGDDGRLISLVFENFTGKWERTVDFRWTDSTILKGKLYSQKEMPSEIVIPEGITEIADSVFMDCTQIEKVTLPSTLKVIGAGAFKDCTNLKEINIPYGVTTIGERAFENCTSVYMVLPDTVTTIGDGAFSGCTQFDGTCKPSPIIPGTEDFTLIRPSDSTYITTQYSEGEEGHDGIDYAGELGDNIYAAADGVVIDVVDDKSDDSYGIHITIKHEHNGQELQTFYAHLNEAIVKKGDKVSQGDVIGYMGSTGWSTGPHVHFSLSVDGVALNPNLYLKSVALKSPVSNGNILYGYGYKQLTGLIYSGEKGQDISAAADGTVSVAEYTNNHGDYVVIDHGNGYQTLYAHLDEIKVKAGETVTIGQTIGTMGDTGSTEGVNLYFELIRNGRQLNPMNYMIAIKSPVSNENILYGYGEYKGHKGIDYAGEKGQDISAAANGTVSLAGWSEGYGNCVVINHDNGYQTLYGHLDEIKVKAGDTVTIGQNIGTMGSTGVTTGVQLHFELLKNGENLNPADYISK